MKPLNVIGKGVRRVDGAEKVTGKALFSDDLFLPGMLCGKALHSAYSHAEIVRLDTEKARALPGVRAVLTARDVKNNKCYHRTGDTWVLADGEVRYIGDIVAIVAADDERTAERALGLIEVEYRPKEPVAQLQEADTGARLVRDDKPDNVAMPLVVTRGDVEADFARADVVVSGKYVFPSLHQVHLEPNSATAVYELGKLTVYCASQVWFHTRHELAKITGVPEKDVVVRTMQIGGAFGARNEQITPILAALLAVACRRPVKLTNTRLEEFLATRPSVGMEIEVSIAADREGNLLSKKSRLLTDFGAFSSDSDAVTAIASMRADTNYHFRSTHVEAHGLYTNRTPTSSYRGFGNPQMHFAQESLLDELAEKLAMDPTELRLKNFIRPGETSIHGFQISSCGLEACMEKAKELIGWEEKRRNPTPGKGIGVAALVHANSSRAGAPEFSGSSAMVRVDSVGRVTAYVGESEIGQGICTVVAQIVAEEFGVDPQEVYVVMGDTDLAPFSTGTNGSKLTTNIGNSVLFACRDAKEQILTVLRERLGMGPVAIEDGKVVGENGGEPLMTLPEAMEKVSYRLSGRPVIGFGSFEPHTVTGDRTGYGHLAPTYPFGVQMAEVTVAENGNFTIDRIVSVHDVGRVVNTQMALGQIYGGVMQAVGFTTLEDLAPNEHGVYAANTLLEYKAPTVWEMPEILGTFVETNDPFGPYGAKGIGEPPIIAVAPAVANAIYNACGVRFREIPITPVRIRQKKLEQQRVRAGEKKEDGL